MVLEQGERRVVVLGMTRREESGCFRDNKAERRVVVLAIARERRVVVLDIIRKEESGGFRDIKGDRRVVVLEIL